MKILGSLTLALALLTLAPTGSALAASSGELLQQGLYAEEVEGNIDAAIKLYAQVIKNSSAPPNAVGQALYRQGMCYLKLKDEPAARAALEKLVADYPGQTELVEKAKPVLDDLTDFDPAVLMPPGTLAYVEFGSPGRQIETILSLLKGTPFENPLAAIGGQPAAGSGQRSPGDLVAALLNPSMMAEFKKIRSLAIGVTGIAQNNPPMISVLYPGKSDALRGLILAALGMGGTPGEPIEGMQTVNIRNFGSVAYDDKVIIIAQPAGQLPWSVRQYKRAISEPTLASSNKSFVKLSKNQRQKNALTVWANVDEAYARVLQMFPGQVPAQILSANAFVDFNNIDELILTESVETNGLGSRIDLRFKDGHHSVAYDLIRTPNIATAALEAVPAEAIAVASFSLGQTGAAQADKVRTTIQNVTGLDLGREIFANVEQITVFALPAEGSSSSSATNAFLPDRLGLAITSRNPEQTRQILTTLLGTANTMNAGQPGAGSGQYKVGRNGQQDLYCYVEQVNKTTLLSLNRKIVDAAVASFKNHKSIFASGSLNSAVKKLDATASKLVLINAGGAIRLLASRLNPGSLTEEQSRQFNASLDQLARATDATTVELRTDEELNNFTLTSSVTGIPPLNQILAPAMQISRISSEAIAEATAKSLRQEAPAIILPARRAPVIDADRDELWNAARPYKLENVMLTPPASSTDLSAEYRALWDENNLYVLVEVTDDILKHDSAPDKWYESDSVEIYIDADNAKGSQYGPYDCQYAFSWDKTSPFMQEAKHSRTNGVQYSMVTTEKGYRVAVKFPWSTLGAKPSLGAKIGLDVHVNDNDSGGKRDSKIAWHDQNDNAWENPQAFGNAALAGMIGWWKFDETQGTTAADSSGGHHNGTLVGNAKWGKGKTGGAIDLDGAGSFVRIADKAAFNNSGGEMTVACWVNIRSVPVEWMAIVTKGDTAWRLSTYQQQRQFHFAINDFGQFNDQILLNGAATVSANDWHHLAAVYNGSTMSVYVDGKLDASRPCTSGIGQNDFEVLIGENAELKDRCFNGLIDDVRIYNYGLSESQIKALAAGQ